MKLFQGLFGGATIREMNSRREWSKKEDVLKPFYQHMDLSRVVISGSYALNQFTGDKLWEPNDVDILTTARDIDHFRTMVQDFCAQSSGEMVKFNDFAAGHPDRSPEEDRRDEKFHEAIRASAKVQVPGVPLVLQFVWIQGLNGDAAAEVQLEKVSDLPSCVSYKVVDGRRFFIVPEKGAEALFTRRVDACDICPARMEKYRKRNYDFF